LSLLVLSSPAFGGTLVISFIIGVALLILGIEIIAVAVKGSRIRMIPKGHFGR
jgi:ABC-type nickel/cobalt efflux system permease component RcnA